MILWLPGELDIQQYFFGTDDQNQKKILKSVVFDLSPNLQSAPCSVRRLVKCPSIGSGRAEIVLSNVLTPRHPVSIYYHTTN